MIKVSVHILDVLLFHVSFIWRWFEIPTLAVRWCTQHIVSMRCSWCWWNKCYNLWSFNMQAVGNVSFFKPMLANFVYFSNHQKCDWESAVHTNAFKFSTSKIGVVLHNSGTIFKLAEKTLAIQGMHESTLAALKKSINKTLALPGSVECSFPTSSSISIILTLTLTQP